MTWTERLRSFNRIQEVGSRAAIFLMWTHDVVPGLWPIPKLPLTKSSRLGLPFRSRCPKKAEIIYDLCSVHVQCIHRRNSQILKRLFSLVIDIYGNAPHCRRWSIDRSRIWTKGLNKKSLKTAKNIEFCTLTWQKPFYLPMSGQISKNLFSNIFPHKPFESDRIDIFIDTAIF